MLLLTAPLMIGIRELLSIRPWCVSDLLVVGLLGVGCSIHAAAYRQFESHKQSEAGGLLEDRGWSIFRRPVLAHLRPSIRPFRADKVPLQLSQRCPSSHGLSSVILGNTSFSRLALLGALANYAFLWYIGGDRKQVSSQRERYGNTVIRRRCRA